MTSESEVVLCLPEHVHTCLTNFHPHTYIQIAPPYINEMVGPKPQDITRKPGFQTQRSYSKLQLLDSCDEHHS